MTKRILSSVALAAFAAALAACASTSQQTAQPPAKFDTPPNWLDRVSVVAYMPYVDYDTPRPLGDYENEDATRWMFRGHPLHPSDEDQTYEALPADQGEMDVGGGEE